MLICFYNVNFWIIIMGNGPWQQILHMHSVLLLAVGFPRGLASGFPLRIFASAPRCIDAPDQSREYWPVLNIYCIPVGPHHGWYLHVNFPENNHDWWLLGSVLWMPLGWSKLWPVWQSTAITSDPTCYSALRGRPWSFEIWDIKRWPLGIGFGHFRARDVSEKLLGTNWRNFLKKSQGKHGFFVTAKFPDYGKRSQFSLSRTVNVKKPVATSLEDSSLGSTPIGSFIILNHS